MRRIVIGHSCAQVWAWLLLFALIHTIATPVYGQVPILQLKPNVTEVLPKGLVSFEVVASGDLATAPSQFDLLVSWSGSADFVADSSYPAPDDDGITSNSITWRSLSQLNALPSFRLRAGDSSGEIEVEAELDFAGGRSIKSDKVVITVGDTAAGAPDITTTPSAILTPVLTPTESPSPTATKTNTVTPSPASSLTHTPTPTGTWTPTDTATNTATPLVTSTEVPASIEIPPASGVVDGGASDDRSPSTLLIIGVVALLTALGAGVLLLFLLRGRGKPKSPPPFAAAAPVAPAPLGSSFVTSPLPTGSASLESLSLIGMRIRLESDVITIGRAPDSTIRIDERYMNWETVSRKHAEIRREGGDYVIYDVSSDRRSSNGVYVEGRRTVRNVLRSGWRIGIGAVEFIFRDAAAGEQ